mmetsp:Transcript_20678/g.49250  ORF Transcript_20678/g.49250 Transcript_20678/m.49250 type:complete len:296 (+) Transcript_20678:1137-2024(+)
MVLCPRTGAGSAGLPPQAGAQRGRLLGAPRPRRARVQARAPARRPPVELPPVGAHGRRLGPPGQVPLPRARCRALARRCRPVLLMEAADRGHIWHGWRMGLDSQAAPRRCDRPSRGAALGGRRRQVLCGRRAACLRPAGQPRGPLPAQGSHAMPRGQGQVAACLDPVLPPELLPGKGPPPRDRGVPGLRHGYQSLMAGETREQLSLGEGLSQSASPRRRCERARRGEPTLGQRRPQPPAAAPWRSVGRSRHMHLNHSWPSRRREVGRSCWLLRWAAYTSRVPPPPFPPNEPLAAR